MAIFDDSPMMIAPQQQAPNQWESLRNMLANPQVGAALLQTGLQLMQPVAPGQSRLGHIAQGVGAGVETFGRESDRQADEDKAAREERRIDAGISDQQADRELERQRLTLYGQDVASNIKNREASQDVKRLQLENVYKARTDFINTNASLMPRDELLKMADELYPLSGGAKAPTSTAPAAEAAEATPKEPLPLLATGTAAAKRSWAPGDLFDTAYDPVVATGRELSGLVNTVGGFFAPQGPAADLAKKGPQPKAQPQKAEPKKPDAKQAAGIVQYKEGDIVRNPKTGQRVQFRGGQWIQI